MGEVVVKNKLLITGASGFLGYHLIQSALEHGYEVFAAVRTSSKIEHLSSLPIKVVYADLSNHDEILQLLNSLSITHIIHAAATTKALTEQDYNYNNATITQVIASAANATNIPIKKFIFISSLAALGPSLTGKEINETQAPAPITLYGKSKLLAETLLKQHVDLPYIILRPTAIYGPREQEILAVFKTLKKGVDLYLGRHAQTLSFVYVSDLAKLTIDCLSNNIANEDFNISDGFAYDKYAMNALAKKQLQKKAWVIHLPVSAIRFFFSITAYINKKRKKASMLTPDKLQELIADWPCDCSKAKKQLHYQPAYNLEKGMQQTIEWYMANGWL